MIKGIEFNYLYQFKTYLIKTLLVLYINNLEMESTQPRSIVDVLREKDNVQVDIPKDWSWIKANKNDFLLRR